MYFGYASMYLVCTCTYLLLLLSPALQDFKECCVMQKCRCQMLSNYLQIRTTTGEITEIPEQRMKNILTDRMQPPWKRQSAGL
jgi:hypothetical protein